MENSKEYKNQSVLVQTLIDSKYEWRDSNDKRTKEEFIEDELDNIKGGDKSSLGSSYQVGMEEVAAKADMNVEEFEKMLSSESTLNDEVSNKIQNNISGKDVLQILSKIHDKWVTDNSKRFASKLEQGKGYQYGPIEMIGWKEAKSDLLFLKPMLEAAGVEISEAQLEAEYSNMQKNFMIGKGIRTQDDYSDKLAQGGEFYEPLNGEEKTVEQISIEKENGTYVEPISNEIKNNPAIASKMAEQTFEKVELSAKKEYVHDKSEFAQIARENPKAMYDTGKIIKDEQEQEKANLNNEKETDGSEKV